MIAQQKRKPIPSAHNTINSPRKSDNGSVKSSGSKKSITNKNGQKIAQPRKNSIYDSDT